MDAFFLMQQDRIGIGMCIRRLFGVPLKKVVWCWLKQFSFILFVGCFQFNLLSSAEQC